jgi:hypothetical protein
MSIAGANPRASAGFQPPKSKFKKQILCRQDDLKRFTLQPLKSADDLEEWNFEKMK